jgi:hypothetical protein
MNTASFNIQTNSETIVWTLMLCSLVEITRNFGRHQCLGISTRHDAITQEGVLRGVRKISKID